MYRLPRTTILPFPQRSTPPQRIVVGVPDEAPWNEVSAMVVDSCHQLGLAAELVTDGAEHAFDADLLLLPGSGRWYPKFEELSRRLDHRRPKIVLWHLQPLPPPVFTRRARELGTRLLSGQLPDLFGDWLRPLTPWLHLARHGRTAVQRLLGVQVLLEFERIGGPEYGNIGWNDLLMIFEEANWLSQQWSEQTPWIDEVVTDTPTRFAFLQQHGIPARFVPLGYHEGWGCDSSRERDVDVMVFGAMRSPGRASVVRQVLSRLRAWGYTSLVNPVFPASKLRVPLLQRARIVLNVLRMPWEFPGLRLFPSVACGALVVSNTAIQNEPFQEGIDFVPAPKARMAESIAYLLDHEEERLRRAAVARRHLAEHLSMRSAVARLLQVDTGASRGRLAAA
jgi:hypothetical protein